MDFVIQVKAFTNSWQWPLWVLALPLLGMPLFYLLQRRRGGLQISARVQKAGGSIFLPPWIMEYGYWGLSTPGNFLVRRQVSPNSITFAGFAVVLCGCAFAAAGWFGLAGPLLLIGSLSDMLDGFVARERGLCSDAGEFIDAIVDRYADIALVGCLCFYYVHQVGALALVLLALMGSVMVSYARAKAESLGVHDAPGGPMRRAERAVYLGFAIMLAPTLAHFTEPPGARPQFYLVLVVCALVGVLTNLSAIQMTFSIHAALRRLQNK
jgi:phosphatidylglycerophosphate synthase